MAVSSLGINHEDLRLLLLAAACQSTKRNGNQRALGQRPASRFAHKGEPHRTEIPQSGVYVTRNSIQVQADLQAFRGNQARNPYTEGVSQNPNINPIRCIQSAKTPANAAAVLSSLAQR